MSSPLHDIARRFSGGQAILAITPLGNGLINDTYKVTASGTDFVLQRINSRVFPNSEQLVANIRQLGRHISRQPADSVHLQIPALIPGDERKTVIQDMDGHFWRAQQLIQPAESRERLSNSREAEQVGFALGHFHRLCSSLDTGLLYDTLPGFHITPGYFRHYQQIIQSPTVKQNSAEARFCQAFIKKFQDKIDVLERPRQQGILTERVMHGDPKLNNFLFKPGSNSIISLIDLDTVKPGLVHYDIGDCLRSCCHLPQNNQFDMNFCQTILTSYLREAGQFFTPADHAYLYSAILLIPFELGLRFFTDYLQGNQYFRVSEPEENLRRAVAQFELCKSIGAQQVVIEGMIAGFMCN
ncbi:MAG: aminoglycoside phosphotransferase family protein [Methylococcales bacterium]|nr:aminoglycoside phosphotransferase family protein [Methylococcales bacterium]